MDIPRDLIRVNNFVLYRWIEIVLIIAGLGFFIVFRPGTFYRGVGTGLFIQSFLMLMFDLIAESRGKIYLDYLMSV